MISQLVDLQAAITTGGSLRASLVGVGTLSATVDKTKDNPIYSGEYTITPSNVEQVLSTANLTMADNVTIAPIPKNYGLITYNGATILVS